MIILHIDCSARAESHSRRLSAAIVERLRAVAHDALVMLRDLGFEPIPHAEPDYVAALCSTAARSGRVSGAAMRLSEELIREVEAADVLVLGTPTINFAVPSVLKAWIDQVVRIGRTFVPSSGGKRGLLRDRPVLIGIASGGVFTGDRATQPDFLTPYLSAALGCAGLSMLHFLPLQATAFLSPEQVASAQYALLATIDAARIGKGCETLRRFAPPALDFS